MFRDDLNLPAFPEVGDRRHRPDILHCTGDMGDMGGLKHILANYWYLQKHRFCYWVVLVRNLC